MSVAGHDSAGQLARLGTWHMLQSELGSCEVAKHFAKIDLRTLGTNPVGETRNETRNDRRFRSVPVCRISIQPELGACKVAVESAKSGLWASI